MKLIEKNRFIFDLDRTIWDTFDSHGNQIWAKQMIPPYTVVDNSTIKDDVGSHCVLKGGIRDFLKLLYAENKKIGFLSCGAVYGFEKVIQPSLLLLEKFNLKQYFNDVEILEYKTFSKYNYLKNESECVFFDDDHKHLSAVKELQHIKELDAKKIKYWTNVCEL